MDAGGFVTNAAYSTAMAQQRRNDRRPGGGRGGFERGGGGFDRPDRGGFPRADRGGFERSGGGERGGFERRDAAPRNTGFGARPATPRPAFRSEDEGGMNIRLTPRGLNALKTLAGELGMRPGELVTKWVEERLEAERAGGATPEVRTALEARVEELANRVAALEAGRGARSGRSETQAPATSEPPAADATPAAEAAGEATTAMPRRRGRPPKSASASATADAPAATRGRPPKAAAAKASGKRVPLHEEIIAVISERGPLTAAELAAAITERGVFQPPRSGKPLDAATVNSRVSNPVYRARFHRDGHQIKLADS
jgi:hypothetical protein